MHLPRGKEQIANPSLGPSRLTVVALLYKNRISRGWLELERERDEETVALEHYLLWLGYAPRYPVASRHHRAEIGTLTKISTHVLDKGFHIPPWWPSETASSSHRR